MATLHRQEKQSHSRILAAVAAAALCLAQARAQDATPVSASAPLTLEAALAAARETSPALDAASANLRASSAARTVAGLRPNPSLEAQTENVGSTDPYGSPDTTVGFAFSLELGGKRSAHLGTPALKALGRPPQTTVRPLKQSSGSTACAGSRDAAP